MPQAFSELKGVLVNEIRNFDWSGTPIGAIECWPVALKTAVSLMLGSPFPMCIVTKKGLTTLYNDAFVPILGAKPDPLGKGFDDIWGEAWDQIEGFVRKAFDGEATFIENFPLEVSRGSGNELAYFTFSYSPLRDESGHVIGMVDTVIETTFGVKAKEESRLLSQELGHRLKNTLAIVQAIASQTLSKIADKDALRAFESRLIGLSKAHDILLQENWASAHMRAIVDGAMSLHAGQQRFSAEGPDILVGPKGGLSLSMLLHELATNAVKYGSLSVAEGKVLITWRVEDGNCVLDWVERGGPPAAEPTRKGVGSRLIAAGLAGTGDADLRYTPLGVTATFKVPIAHLRDH